MVGDRRRWRYSADAPGAPSYDPLLAEEIADDLRSALAQIEDVLGDLQGRVGASTLREEG
ncbi:MAG: hypothetical protein AB7U23_11200 [Dehalococcoidia bacterium]